MIFFLKYWQTQCRYVINSVFNWLIHIKGKLKIFTTLKNVKNIGNIIVKLIITSLFLSGLKPSIIGI